ncbi:MAG: ABC transporter ATP-binding protein [Chloroflexi bacterium]|nr:ABC transporter ATP-binding protein [Chloroflexota bacterium]
MNSSPPLIVENLSFRYRQREDTAISDVSFTVAGGELLLIAGASGCGKTTLARCINGLIPRSYKGEISGTVRLYGEEVRDIHPSRIAQSVGTLLQDPEKQILGAYVSNEVAFGLENLGIPRPEMIDRVRAALERLNIGHLYERETFSLSGGEKQKVALAGALVMEPKLLILDEPLASLDPVSAQEALAIFRRLADEGIAVLVVEHRVEDVLSIHPDRVLYMESGEVRYLGPPDDLAEKVDIQQVKLPAPIVIQKARAMGMQAKPLDLPSRDAAAAPLLEFKQVNFHYTDGPQVLFDIDLTIHKGDVIALLGPNGAGKSTLVKHAIGLLKPTSGEVILYGRDTRKNSVAQMARAIGYVFQSPTQMLFAPTVNEELAFGPRNLDLPEETVETNTRAALQTTNLNGYEEYSPLALSFGQQKRVGIASILAMASRILVMDEPTAGQDFANHSRFMNAIVGAENGASLLAKFDATLFITHDLDLAVVYANRVILVANGRIMADGLPHAILADRQLLAACRVVPTSLLNENLKRLPRTGRFMSAEALAAFA